MNPATEVFAASTVFCNLVWAAVCITLHQRTKLLKEMVDLLAAESAGRVAPGTAYSEIVEEETKR